MKKKRSLKKKEPPQRIKDIAFKIVELEKQYQTGQNPESCENNLLQITSSLSLTDMILVDDFIRSHNLI